MQKQLSIHFRYLATGNMKNIQGTFLVCERQNSIEEIQRPAIAGYSAHCMLDCRYLKSMFVLHFPYGIAATN